MTFGRVLREARERARRKQKEVAALVRKENGEPLTAQYLNDIEHDRRNPPPPYIIEQLAAAVEIAPDILYYWAGEIPKDLRGIQTDPELVIKAYRSLRKTLTRNIAA